MVQDQGVSRMGSLKGLSPWFADGHTLAAFSHGLFPAPVLSKDINQIGFGHTIMASF